MGMFRVKKVRLVCDRGDCMAWTSAEGDTWSDCEADLGRRGWRKTPNGVFCPSCVLDRAIARAKAWKALATMTGPSVCPPCPPGPPDPVPGERAKVGEWPFGA